MEQVIWRVFFPMFLAGVTVPIVAAVGLAAASWGVYFTVLILWAIVINGGFAIWDGDLDWFD